MPADRDHAWGQSDVCSGSEAATTDAWRFAVFPKKGVQRERVRVQRSMRQKCYIENIYEVKLLIYKTIKS